MEEVALPYLPHLPRGFSWRGLVEEVALPTSLTSPGASAGHAAPLRLPALCLQLPRRSWRSSCRRLLEACSSRWLSDSCFWSPVALASDDSSC